MRVLVTGGAGFIGSHTIDRLLSEGHNAAIVDNLATGSESNVNPAALWYKVDIIDASALRSAFAEFRPDIVLHLAAQIDVRHSTREPAFDAKVNVIGSLNVIEACIEFGVRKIVYTSSGGAIYGEPLYLPVREDHAINPISPYGISKHTVEHYLSLYHRIHGLSYATLRYSNVYGPRQNPHGEAGVIAIFGRNMVLGMDCTIFGDGEQTRDYVFVDDVVDANLRALTAGDCLTVNVGCGVATSVNEVRKELAVVVGRERSPIYASGRPGEVNAISLDPSLAREQLGWSATTSLREGIGKTVIYLQSLQAQNLLA